MTRRYRFRPLQFTERLTPASRQRIEVLRPLLRELWNKYRDEEIISDLVGRIGTEMMAILDAELGVNRHNKWRNGVMDDARRKNIGKHSRAYWEQRRKHRRV